MVMEDNFVKITNATYQILDFLPENDPLKNRSKEKVLAILENLTVLFGISEKVLAKSVEGELLQGYNVVIQKTSYQVLDDINILENYLLVAKHQRWIDATNGLIISGQYQQIKNRVLEFLPPKPPLSVTPLLEQQVEKPRHFTVSQTSLAPVLNQELASHSKALERQAKILDILSKCPQAQVMDFIKELPDITKRTIRRDLNDLLVEGKVIRVGEWNQVFYKLP